MLFIAEENFLIDIDQWKLSQKYMNLWIELNWFVERALIFPDKISFSSGRLINLSHWSVSQFSYINRMSLAIIEIAWTINKADFQQFIVTTNYDYISTLYLLSMRLYGMCSVKPSLSHILRRSCTLTFGINLGMP